MTSLTALHASWPQFWRSRADLNILTEQDDRYYHILKPLHVRMFWICPWTSLLTSTTPMLATTSNTEHCNTMVIADYLFKGKDVAKIKINRILLKHMWFFWQDCVCYCRSNGHNQIHKILVQRNAIPLVSGNTLRIRALNIIFVGTVQNTSYIMLLNWPVIISPKQYGSV